jgi:putative phosphoesterase
MIGILSDIHGNYFALKEVMRELDAYQCDKIICLGDTVGYYSMADECIALLIERNAITLKGNHESYFLDESFCTRSKIVNECLAYQKETVSNAHYSWLMSLKPLYREGSIDAVHGGWHDYLEEYVQHFDFDNKVLSKRGNTIFLSGHTHIQMLEEKNGILYCNPGSVGQPRDFDPRAAYATLHNGKISLHRVEYDIDRTAKSMRQAGFKEYCYMNLYSGTGIGKKALRKEELHEK